MPSPACEVKNGAAAYVSTAGGVDVTPGAVVVIRLVSAAGVNLFGLSCVSTDGLLTPAGVNAGLVLDAALKTSTFTCTALLGTCMIFESVIENGVKDGVAFAGYRQQFAIHTLASNGLRVAALNETDEAGAGGWEGKVNAAIRGVAGGGASSPWHNAPISEKTASYTILSTDACIVFTGSTAAQTLTLPAAPTAGDSYEISNEASVAVTLAGSGGNTVRGAASIVLQPGQAIVVRKSTSTNWTTI